MPVVDVDARQHCSFASQVYVMVNEALSDSPTDNLDYSMKQELDQARGGERGSTACS
jgi:hypothetical protein